MFPVCSPAFARQMKLVEPADLMGCQLLYDTQWAQDWPLWFRAAELHPMTPDPRSYPFDLGAHHRAVTTAVPAAQVWFDRGLVWCYGFNHDEAAACFRRAIDADSDCAMAYWGLAYASGPFYNMPWDFFSPGEIAVAVPLCHEAVESAHARAAAASPVERALIAALRHRFPIDSPGGKAEFVRWEQAYGDAMRHVYHDYPDDLDVVALFAEALITRTPWMLWDVSSGEPAIGADTVEAMGVLEDGLARVGRLDEAPHPGLIHMYIHTMEMSPTPERALDVADLLSDVAADSGHLHHMPSHIYILCGKYEEALAVNEIATAVDSRYLEFAGAHNFYTTAYCHNLHLIMYAGMLLGQQGPALAAARAITETLTPDVLRTDKPHLAITLEGYYSMMMHVLVRFGQWQAIVHAPLPDDPVLYRVTTAMYHYARGVAHAATGDIVSAEIEREQFIAAHAAVPIERRFFNNSAHDILCIASAMLDGELAYRKKNFDKAFENLRLAVHRDDNLAYTEPWAWMHPPRHALGALLLEQGHVTDAAAVYRADLGLDGSLSRPMQHPDNIWSLHGYVECLSRLGRDDEAAQYGVRLEQARTRADVEVHASCCCRQLYR